jgi:hypothetical protein
MTYKIKYARAPEVPAHHRPKWWPGRKISLDWTDESTAIDIDRRYAWMKHKAQAKFRNEEHTISYEEWCELWTVELFLLRGRRAQDYCMYKQDIELGWHADNVTVGVRQEYLNRAREYRSARSD